MHDKCQGKTKAGKPCQATKQKGSDFCFFHDPEKETARAAARSQGGRSTAVLSRAEVLVGELVTQADEAQEKDSNKDRVKHNIKDLDDLQRFAELQIQYINDNKKYLKLSSSDRIELRKWADFLLKLLIVKGLGAEQRIRQLESIAAKHDSPYSN